LRAEVRVGRRQRRGVGTSVRLALLRGGGERRQAAVRRIDDQRGLSLHVPARTNAAAATAIEEPELIERILAHRREWGEEGTPMASLGPRAPPQPLLF